MLRADCLPKNAGTDWASSANVDVEYGFDNISQNLCEFLRGFPLNNNNNDKNLLVFVVMDPIPTVQGKYEGLTSK